jgi:hypothetical protein
MKKELIISGIIGLLIILSFSGCVEEIKELSNKLQINSFQISPGIINKGETANLSWAVSGATSVTIDNGIGEVSLQGSRIVAPTTNTTYTLTAENSTTSKTATAYIIVIGGTGQENAAVVGEATSEYIKITLAKGGQNYNNGYDNSQINIYVDDQEVDITSIGKWDVGEQIIIGKTNGIYTVNGNPIYSGTYSVTVVIYDTVIYDGEIEIA